jgi:hypothetical protein
MAVVTVLLGSIPVEMEIRFMTIQKAASAQRISAATIGAFAFVMAVCASSALAQQDRDDDSQRKSIISISVCSLGAHDRDDASSTQTGSCPHGSIDTAMSVLVPDGSVVNGSYGGLSTLADEHSTILPPDTIPHHRDYLLFVASRTNLQPDASGVVVLTGGSGPNADGQWTLDFARDFGLYQPGNLAGQQNGQTFLSAMDHLSCPTVRDPAHQDQTFDLNYADPGTVVVDPTSWENRRSGNLLMIYEGTNRCIGIAKGKNLGNNFYSTIGVATSFDGGHTWPTYRSNWLSPGLPSVNPTVGPADPLGAFGASVCIGNDCSTNPPADYGRYAVLSPPVTVAEAMMKSPGGLTGTVGDSEPSAFVGDVKTDRDGTDHDKADRDDFPYLYVVHNYAPGPFPEDPPLPPNLIGDLTIARAQLNGGSTPLQFKKWYQGAFNEPGLGNDGGGRESQIFPGIDSSLFGSCLAPDQARAMGSISYVEETQEYLLTFVCSSPADPDITPTDPGGIQAGAAWFYSTIDATRFDLSHQEQWSRPREIVGSWGAFTGSKQAPGCFRNFNGWYPSLMSLNEKPGYLGTHGYVFYMQGCTDNDTPGGRVFSTRAFTISTDRARH